jgi:hypothetical protein
MHRSRPRPSDVPSAALVPSVIRLAVLSLGIAVGWFGLTGCSTPGPLHVYVLEDAGNRPIVDLSPSGPFESSSFLKADEKVSGFAYDPFTDHFFLRLEPGNRIRVVDRPARAIKREFEIAGLPNSGGGDLAVRPRDGHLFLIHEEGAAIAETTRLGKLVRTFRLDGLAQRAGALALDPTADRLFALMRDGRLVTLHDFTGKKLSEFRLERTVILSLGFDPASGRLYGSPRDDSASVVTFALDGQQQQTLQLRHPASAVDVGPRSFIRVF